MKASWIVILWHRMWLNIHVRRCIKAREKRQDYALHVERGLVHSRAIYKINDELTRITEIKPRKRKGKSKS